MKTGEFTLETVCDRELLGVNGIDCNSLSNSINSVQEY